MNYAASIKTASDLLFLGSSSSHQDYEDALELVEYVIEHAPDSPLVEELTHLMELEIFKRIICKTIRIIVTSYLRIIKHAS
ncbi:MULTISPECIES: hypothetical protein [Enterobacter]|uniref:hypothetical protein n=1 Tax=Enterobacter TaxID=547 RepID=UPI0003866D91|nr:hypothetical protein [Enterobacter roggenkampii]EPY94814.1 hypothetical protein L799_19970 [Enterobacter roggenkampii EC_38VIM1]CAE6229231.1 hypothetical protein AI2704V1_1120 [Enterobacter cloacae]KTK02202.1 hypothetical protein ASU70_05650 [Enterobacter roggenkampii]CAE6300548.1 hypothetical protein AI2710V1_1212 [Enterobacter cloacae]CAF3121688.1 hypothetical protein AI2992V5_1055 [Enterobacter cloacae]